MALLFLLQRFSLCLNFSTPSYYAYSLEPGSEGKISLSSANFAAFLFNSDEPLDISTSVIADRNTNKAMHTNISYLFVEGDEVHIINHMKANLNVDLWVADKAICSENAVLFNTPYGISFSVALRAKEGGMCFFNRAHSQSKILVSTSSSSTPPVVRFYRPIDIAERRQPISCSLECSFETGMPHFIAFEPINRQVSSDVTIRFNGETVGLDSKKCFVEQMSLISPKQAIDQSVQMRSEAKCFAAEDGEKVFGNQTVIYAAIGIFSLGSLGFVFAIGGFFAPAQPKGEDYESLVRKGESGKL